MSCLFILGVFTVTTSPPRIYIYIYIPRLQSLPTVPSITGQTYRCKLLLETLIFCRQNIGVQTASASKRQRQPFCYFCPYPMCLCLLSVSFYALRRSFRPKNICRKNNKMLLFFFHTFLLFCAVTSLGGMIVLATTAMDDSQRRLGEPCWCMMMKPVGSQSVSQSVSKL